MSVFGSEARCLTDNAVNVFYSAAAHTLDVMVVVANACLVVGTCRFGQAHAAQHAYTCEVVDDAVDGLSGDTVEAEREAGVDRIGIGMGMGLYVLERLEPWHRDAQAEVAQHCTPLLGRAFSRCLCHASIIAPYFELVKIRDVGYLS